MEKSGGCAGDRARQEGLEGIIAGETAISTLADGLRYRGYAIQELAAQSSFEEVAYLVLHGDLPDAVTLRQFQSRLAAASVDPAVLQVVRDLPATAPLLDRLRTGVSLLSHYDPARAAGGRDASLRKAEQLLAQFPLLLAAARCKKTGPITPTYDPGHGLAENVLRLVGGTAATPRAIPVLNATLIMYADHEFNASTFTARVVASTLSDLYAAVVAALSALQGPLHGGALERIGEALHEAFESGDPDAWVQGLLARKQRVMGFGHRVYKHGDIRAQSLQPLCRELAFETGNERLEQAAEQVEQAMRLRTGLHPNVDWPSARIFRYLGFSAETFTPLFALSRISGWCAHIIEQQSNNRLIQPRASYAGVTARTVPRLEDRP